MDCPHEKLEEMYGISFCVECGEEITTTIGEIKGGFWKHGRSLKGKMTQDDKLQKDMFRYKFPYEVTLEAIKLYRHYLTVTGGSMKGKARKTIAFGCLHVAFMNISGSVDEGKLLEVIGIKGKSGQRGLAQVTATLNRVEAIENVQDRVEAIGNVQDGYGHIPEYLGALGSELEEEEEGEVG